MSHCMIPDEFGEELKSFVREDGRLSGSRIHHMSQRLKDFCEQMGLSTQECYVLWRDQLPSKPVCAYCGKPITFSKSRGCYNTYCSKPCIGKAIQDAKKQTCLKKWGVDNPLKSKEIREKVSDTLEQRYGVRHPCQSEEIRKHSEQTCQERYGVKHSIQNPQVQKKLRETNLAKRGVEYPQMLPEVRAKAKQTLTEWLHEFEVKNNCTQLWKIIAEYNQAWISLKLPKIHCRKYSFISNEYLPLIKQYSETSKGPSGGGVSAPEKDVVAFVRSVYSGTVEENCRKLLKNNGESYELDMYIPEKNLGIEYDGDFWHSTLHRPKNYGKWVPASLRLWKFQSAV